MEEKARVDPGLPRANPTRSYWQIPPESIADEGTSAKLPSYAETVIIGSGISGASFAYHLLQRGRRADMVMLEARQACSGATGRNGGHTKAASYRTYPAHAEKHGTDEANKIARLEYNNIVETHRLAKELGLDCESRPCQTVDIVYDEDTFVFANESVKMMKDAMPDDPASEYLFFHNKDEIESRFLTPDRGLVGAVEYEAGSISAYKFAIGLLKHSLARGLKLFTHTSVEKIKAVTAEQRSAHPESRVSVETSKGTIVCKDVIMATNGYTAHLVSEFQGKIVPLRGQVMAHKPSPKLAELRPLSLEHTYSLVYKTGYEYMIPRPFVASVPQEHAGDIIIGGGIGGTTDDGLSEYGNTDDTGLNNQISAYLKESMPNYFGRNWGQDDPAERVRAEWSGVMGITADGLPFVGPLSSGGIEEGLWVIAGFNGHGMVLCLKCAEALASLISGEDARRRAWFPSSFLISDKRLSTAKFEGRKGLKIDRPPEVATAQ